VNSRGRPYLSDPAAMMRRMSVRAVLAVGAVALAAAAAGGPPPASPAVSPLGTDLTQLDLTMAAQGCGTERWAVKTASDSQRYAVSTTQHQTTIAALRSLKAPSSLPANSRIMPTEVTEYVIAGTLTGYKAEADGDDHLVITDSAGRSMIVELVNPQCVAAARFKTEITNVRKQFSARYGPTSGMQNPRQAIRVRGIGLFDYHHGQTGVAPNGIELHPVLGLGFP
jgi:hypothetical protein